MNVGIVTFQYAYNYGAVLQCLALQRAVERLGVDVEVINYLPPNAREYPIWRGWGLRNGDFFEALRRKRLRIYYAKGIRDMRIAFERFRAEHLNLSSACVSNEEIEKVAGKCDALICGSDQIWHFTQSPVYFLEWGYSYHGKRIAYAPCCGKDDQVQDRVWEIQKWLARFDHISVRNEVSQRLIQELTGEEIPIVADPTLLTDLSDVQRKVELPCAKYILTYTLGGEIDGGNCVAIEKIRERVGNIPVVAVVPSAHQPHFALWADIKVTTAGPAEWLWLVSNAAFILTDSYHGALFSIKNRIPFFAFYTEKERAPRLLDLAKRYALINCVGGSVEEALEADWGWGCDWLKSESLISTHVKESFAYLRKAVCSDQ